MFIPSIQQTSPGCSHVETEDQEREIKSVRGLFKARLRTGLVIYFVFYLQSKVISPSDFQAIMKSIPPLHERSSKSLVFFFSFFFLSCSTYTIKKIQLMLSTFCLENSLGKSRSSLDTFYTFQVTIGNGFVNYFIMTLYASFFQTPITMSLVCSQSSLTTCLPFSSSYLQPVARPMPHFQVSLMIALYHKRNL